MLSLVIFYALIIEGNSRNSIIIPAISMVFTMWYLFPSRFKSTMIYCGVVVAIVATITTIWKNTINEAIHAQDFDHSSISYWVSYLEVYFAGISNVGKYPQ